MNCPSVVDWETNKSPDLEYNETNFLSPVQQNSLNQSQTHRRPSKGKRKIKIEFIPDKSRRQITFSKRKAGLFKKVTELTTLTGTQGLLLLVSESGHLFSFATPTLQPILTSPEGKALIESCLRSEQRETESKCKSAVNSAPQNETNRNTFIDSEEQSTKTTSSANSQHNGTFFGNEDLKNAQTSRFPLWKVNVPHLNSCSTSEISRLTDSSSMHQTVSDLNKTSQPPLTTGKSHNSTEPKLAPSQESVFAIQQTIVSRSEPCLLTRQLPSSQANSEPCFPLPSSPKDFLPFNLPPDFDFFLEPTPNTTSVSSSSSSDEIP